MTQSNGSGPDPDEVTRVTNVIVDALGSVDLESALTVVCNIAGQLICALSEDKPSLIQQHGNMVAENVKKAAITKLLYDDANRRVEEEEADAEE